MTTNFVLLNQGPGEIRLTPVNNNGELTGLAEIVVPERHWQHYVYGGQSYLVQEESPMLHAEEARDKDIIEYGTVRGEQRTIHASERLDVEVDDKGRVVAVWFRCATIPFQQVQVGYQRAADMRAAQKQTDKLGLLAVTLRRKP